MFFSSGFGSVGARRLLRGLVEWSSVLDTRGLSNCWSVGSWIQKGVEGDRSGRDRRCVCMTLWQEREWRPRLSWDEGLYSPPPFSLTIPYKVMNVMNAVAFVVKYCQHVQGDVSGLCPCFVVPLLLPFYLLCRTASVATISHSYVTDLDPSSPCLVNVIVCCLSVDCCFNCVRRVNMPIVRSLHSLGSLS